MRTIAIVRMPQDISYRLPIDTGRERFDRSGGEDLRDVNARRRRP
jgi:hypothetical protein